MAPADFVYQQKHVEQLVSRQFVFDFPADLDPIWSPGNPVRSHMLNGFSLLMPYLEPFLIRAVQRAKAHVTSPELLEDMDGFCRQEANHYKCHRRYNQLLKANGYPELERIEQRMQAAYTRLERRSLRTQLAYAAGFESMTNGMTHWFIARRQTLFAGADRNVSTFWIMHMIEEAEHKTVAYDTYMACSGQYLARVAGVIHGSAHTLGLGLWAMGVALRRDRLLHRPQTLLQMAKELLQLAVNITPFMLRALLPAFNPRQEADPQWMTDWTRAYARLPKGALIPLVDTTDPAMPVPCAAAPLNTAN